MSTSQTHVHVCACGCVCCTHVDIHMCSHERTHTRTCTRMCVHAHMCMYRFVCMHACTVHVIMYIYIHAPHVHVCMHVCMWICVYTRVHIQAHVHTCACACTAEHVCATRACVHVHVCICALASAHTCLCMRVHTGPGEHSVLLGLGPQLGRPAPGGRRGLRPATLWPQPAGPSRPALLARRGRGSC